MTEDIKSKIQKLQQLKQEGKITDVMYKDNLINILGNHIPKVTEEAPTMLATGASLEPVDSLNYEQSKNYRKILENRQRNIARNTAEGRQAMPKGLRISDLDPKSETLNEVLRDLKDQNRLVQNIGDFKQTPNDVVGIRQDVIQKSKFPSIEAKWKKPNLELVQDATEEATKDVAKETPKAEGWASKVLKDKKGMAQLIPTVGLGAAAFGVMPIAKKLQDRDWKGAATDTAEMAANIAFPITSTILNSPEVGAADLPEDEMKNRAIYNASRKAHESQLSNTEPLLSPIPEKRNATKEEMDSIMQSIREKYGKN